MRLFFYWFSLFAGVYFFTSKAVGNETPLLVFAKEDNIYYEPSIGKYEPSIGKGVRLTARNIDSNPILSPDRRVAAFIRRSHRIIPNGCAAFSDSGSKYGNEIWIYDFERKKEKLLVANNFDCNLPEKQIVDPKYLQFSPDSKTLYFVTSAWVTSGAVHAVNTNGRALRYVVPGSTLEVMSKGKYKGYLIVNQHRYFLGGGSYDWYWVFSPAGKEEGSLGPEIDKSQRDVLGSD